jgi:DNA polymerase-3 subunit epsilon
MNERKIPVSRQFPRLAFVDLETTGGAATEDRVTEIGIVQVDEDGVREWSSLVNPQVRIPPFIQSLTGITDDMVSDAPTFAELADEVSDMLDDRVFIAHNARFDYGFLKNEFRRTGHDFRPAVLCTVRLSRKLFPGFSRHNLDALAERHRLEVSQRHRALGDAQLIWQFWNRLHETHAPEAIDDAVSKLLSRPTLPSRLDALRVDEIPSTHGVYLFYGENDLPLYVGKSNNLRRRVLQHFSSDHVSSREMKLMQQVERIDWIETAGEVGALLKEADLVKKLLPTHNQLLRENEDLCAWRLAWRKGRVVPMLVRSDDMFFGFDTDTYGLYNGTRQARTVLRALADEHGLCQVLLGLEKGSDGKPCFSSQVGKCRGVCAGRESIDEHNARVRAALDPLRLVPWPYEGAVAIREKNMWHVVHCWAYLGSVDSEEQARQLGAKGRPRFDRDVYQILVHWLPKMGSSVVDMSVNCT